MLFINATDTISGSMARSLDILSIGWPRLVAHHQVHQRISSSPQTGQSLKSVSGMQSAITQLSFPTHKAAPKYLHSEDKTVMKRFFFILKINRFEKIFRNFEKKSRNHYQIFF